MISRELSGASSADMGEIQKLRGSAHPARCAAAAVRAALLMPFGSDEARGVNAPTALWSEQRGQGHGRVGVRVVKAVI